MSPDCLAQGGGGVKLGKPDTLIEKVAFAGVSVRLGASNKKLFYFKLTRTLRFGISWLCMLQTGQGDMFPR
ncbi:MAG: hypothetical protein Tsb0017_27060 [Geothermobacteraceae bacterium]